MVLLGVLAFLTGLWLGPFLSFLPLSLLGALLSFGFVLTWFEQHGSLTRWGGLLIFASIVSGIGYAYWASTEQMHSHLVTFSQEQPVTFQGVLVAPVRQTPDGLILIVDAQYKGFQGKQLDMHERIRLTWRQPDQGIAYGDHVIFTARLREPYGTLNPGGFNYGEYLKRKGIQAVATVYGPQAIQVQKIESLNLLACIFGRIDQWRQGIHQAATASLSNPALGLFLGMVLGEQSFIEQEVRDAFMASGTVHILSISGSHLGMLALLLFGGARWGMRQLPAAWLERLSVCLTASRFAVLVTLPVVSFYTLLAGAEMATIRSWIMIVVCCVGIWFGRERNLMTALAVAAFIMVLPHPEAIHDISFQLSYLSVAAIAVVLLARKTEELHSSEQHAMVSPATSRRYAALWEKGQLAWFMTLAVSLTTLPLVAYYFHQIPWLGLVTNLVVVPLVGIFIIPIGLFSGLGVLVIEGETLPFASVNEWVFNLLAQVVLSLSQVPGAEWHVASPSIISMLIFWGALAGCLIIKHQTPIRWACVATIVGILAWWAWSPRTGWVPGNINVAFLDVGQGDATVLELPDGQTVLIDGGPAYRRLDMGRAVIGPYLWNRGIRLLDHVIATHPQWDHVGGLPWVFQSFDVENYWSNGIPRNKIFFQRLQSAVEAAGLKEHKIGAGTNILKKGPCSLTVLSPSLNQGAPIIATTIKRSGTALNNKSLITKLECGQHSFLLTADAEREALGRLRYIPEGLRSRVVKVPHHGAKSSLHHGWVDQLKAEAVVVSVGSHNRYGHPAPEVLAVYARRGLPMYRTDYDGAIIIEGSLDSPDLRITTAKQQELVSVVFTKNFWSQEWANWQRLLN